MTTARDDREVNERSPRRIVEELLLELLEARTLDGNIQEIVYRPTLRRCAV